MNIDNARSREIPRAEFCPDSNRNWPISVLEILGRTCWLCTHKSTGTSLYVYVAIFLSKHYIWIFFILIKGNDLSTLMSLSKMLLCDCVPQYSLIFSSSHNVHSKMSTVLTNCIPVVVILSHQIVINLSMSI